MTKGIYHGLLRKSDGEWESYAEFLDELARDKARRVAAMKDLQVSMWFTGVVVCAGFVAIVTLFVAILGGFR